MAGESRNLTVLLSSAALLDLDEIWDWNVKRYGADHANRYVAFLLAETKQSCSTNFFAGNPVPVLPRLSYIVIRRRAKRPPGHLAVL